MLWDKAARTPLTGSSKFDKPNVSIIVAVPNKTCKVHLFDKQKY